MNALAKNLLQKSLQLNNLRRAWNDVADNNGIAGVDNVSVRVWRRNWEERLINLARAVRANQYKPGRLRVRKIPKADPRQWRTLRIPTITDRVLQRAVLQQLHPIIDPAFLDCSFGYRPKRGVKDAVRHITTLRRQGYQHVLDADIDDFFNQVDHNLLRQFLQQDLPDDSLMPLLNQWLKAGRPNATVAKGIPMGAPHSPLLANILLHRLDLKLSKQGYALARYADDFIVLTRTQAQAKQAYHAVAAVLAALKLRYEPTKTALTSFDTGFDFLGVHFEETWYWYIWGDKRVQVRDDQEDWLFTRYGPEY